MAYPYDDDEQDPNQPPQAPPVAPTATQPPQTPAAPGAPSRPAPSRRGTGFVGFEQFFSANKESAQAMADKQAEALKAMTATTQADATKGLEDFKSRVAAGTKGATVTKVDPKDPWSTYIATHGSYAGPTSYVADTKSLKAAQDALRLQNEAAQGGGLSSLLSGRAGGANRLAAGRDLAALQEFFKTQQAEADKAIEGAKGEVTAGNLAADTEAAEFSKEATEGKTALETAQKEGDRRARRNRLSNKFSGGGEFNNPENEAVFRHATEAELDLLESALADWESKSDWDKFWHSTRGLKIPAMDVMANLKNKYKGRPIVG